jgi:hypothetical protein
MALSKYNPPIIEVTKEQYSILSSKYGAVVFHREKAGKYQIKTALKSYESVIMKFLENKQ